MIDPNLALHKVAQMQKAYGPKTLLEWVEYVAAARGWNDAEDREREAIEAGVRRLDLERAQRAYYFAGVGR